ncbi:MAG: hypothetical protein WB780_20490 [Candidatus Acidiferrales bacterium]
MQGISRLAFWTLVLVTIVLPSCSEYINNPAPTVTSLAPPSEPAGQPQFTLTVRGKNLTPSSQVQWNPGTGAIPLVSIFMSETEMTALVPAVLVTVPGAAMVTVITPPPGGGTSNPPVTFTISPVASPIPTITALQPSGVLAGSGGFNLLISGKNFVPTSIVTVNNVNRQPTFQNSTALLLSITAQDITQAGQLMIAVLNPPPNGGTSDPVPLTVNNPVPSITTISPTGIQAGTTAPMTLTVTGTGLVTGSQILINGGPRTTALSGSTTLTTQLTAGDFAAGAVDQVQVLNPGPGGGLSNILTFAVNPTATAGLPVILDLAPNGSLANNGVCGTANTCVGGTPSQTTAGPSTSSAGQFVAFASISSNLLANNANTSISDIYLRTTCLTSASCTPTTSLVSSDPNGNAANGASSEPSLSSTGTDVAFTSTATNLITSAVGTNGHTQVFWRPTCSTAPTCTASADAAQLVSISADGTSEGDGDSFNPAISSDGQFVVFVSKATNLVSNVSFDGQTAQVFLRQTCGGVITSTCTPTTFLISTNGNAANGVITPSDGSSANPSVASGGAFVSFTSTAKNLGPAASNPNGLPQIFVRPCTISASICLGQTQIASTPDGTTPANAPSSESVISSNGRFVVFASTATNLGVASSGIQQIYARDTCVTETITTCTPSTILISTFNGSTPGDNISEHPSISNVTELATNAIVAFASLASNLGGNTATGVENIYVRQTCLVTVAACAPTTIVASQPTGNVLPSSTGFSLIPSISGDGHTVSFLSFRSDLVSLLTNGLSNIFLAGTTF